MVVMIDKSNKTTKDLEGNIKEIMQIRFEGLQALKEEMKRSVKRLSVLNEGGY